MQTETKADRSLDGLIDGVKIRRLLAETPLSEIYLAELDIDNRDIVVKLTKPGSAPHATFLAGCELQSHIVHRNVAPVFDYGELADRCYALMSYQAGGNLLDAMERGLTLQRLIKYIKDIARVCDVIHQEGYIHGDIKPENMLIAADERILLTDFGSARPMDSQLGPLSPEYSAPEVAAGKPVDGRADLYSLAVVLYQALVGQLPYRAEGAPELALKHLQEPIPRLPSHLSGLQDFLDSALAKSREHRFDSGASFAAALDEVRDATAVSLPKIKAAAISTREIRGLLSEQPLLSPRDRQRQERIGRRRRRLRVLRRVALSLVLMSSLGAGGYYAVQNNYVDPELLLSRVGLGEDPELSLAWNAAQSLRQDPNQGLASIVAAYRRVLNLSPEHVGATEELASLNSDWKNLIAAALADGNLEFAELRLTEARAVFPNDVDWVQLDTRLQNHLRAERLMQNTAALLTSHGMSDVVIATSAIQSYQEVLRLAPMHTGAQDALRELALHYSDLASAAAQAGDVNTAINLIERATAADKSLASLDAVRETIAQAATTQATIEEMLQDARRARAEDRLLEPAGENAAELFHRVLAIDPSNVVAQQGLLDVTTQIAAVADNLLIEGRMDEVEQLVSQATAVGLVAEGVSEMRRRLENERSRRLTIAENLATAQELMRLGYLTSPLESNAVAKLREVQQIDPGNVAAVDLLAQCAQRLAGVAAEAHAAGMQDEAVQYLDLAMAIDPENQAWERQRQLWLEDPGGV